jgi:hypothetical protein
MNNFFELGNKTYIKATICILVIWKQSNTSAFYFTHHNNKKPYHHHFLSCFREIVESLDLMHFWSILMDINLQLLELYKTSSSSDQSITWNWMGHRLYTWLNGLTSDTESINNGIRYPEWLASHLGWAQHIRLPMGLQKQSESLWFLSKLHTKTKTFVFIIFKSFYFYRWKIVWKIERIHDRHWRRHGEITDHFSYILILYIHIASAN